MPNESLWSRIVSLFNFGQRFRVPPPPLIDRGLGLIYDTQRDITWMQDMNYARTIGHSRDGQMTWSVAMQWVASLNYRGIVGWRLPTALNPDGSGPAIGNNCAGSEIGHLYLEVFANYPNIVKLTNGTLPCIYWTSTEADADKAYAIDLSVLRPGDFVEGSVYRALCRAAFVRSRS